MNATTRVLIITFFILSSIVVSACSSKNAPETSDPSPSFSTALSSVDNKSSTDKDSISALLTKGNGITEISYDLIIVGGGISSESRVWFKETKMKTNTLMNGKRTYCLFDFEKDEVISYLPGEDMATKQKICEYDGLDNITPMDFLAYLNENDYKLTGTQTVNGMECQVLSFSTEEGSFKEWLSKDHGIVVKFEQTLDGQTTTSEYKNIRIGAGAVPVGTFDLPEYIQIIDLNDIMGNVAKCR
ncbi:MAG: DUF4412 domain-containing protein [Peptococcaceae bacterium]|nr:DUF4412 domain-containing protein [Peptococcaceae bacterium]